MSMRFEMYLNLFMCACRSYLVCKSHVAADKKISTKSPMSLCCNLITSHLMFVILVLVLYLNLDVCWVAYLWRAPSMLS